MSGASAPASTASVAGVAVEALRAWRADPVRMVRDLFHVEPDVWQVEVLRAWADPSQPRMRLALQACAGPGKSAVLAWCGWNALLCYSDGVNHPNGAAVSITADNLRNNLWKELALWRERAPLLQAAFEMTAEKIFSREFPTTWFLGARSFAKSADTDAQGRTLSGLHAKAIFYLVDESGDMPPAVLRSAEQGLSNCTWGRIAQAGNPTSQQGALYHAVATQAHLWTVVRITGDPDDARRSPRIDLTWAREQIQLYGRDNPWVMAFILGLFPPGALNALLSADEVRTAMGRHLTEADYGWAQKRLGVDCARFGDDRTVLFPRQGLAAFTPVELRGKRGHEIAARIMLAEARWEHELTIIDSTGGWGQSTEDALIAAGRTPLGIQFHTPAINPRFQNRRAEMHWELAEWVKRGGALPPVPALVAELTTPTYSFVGGKLALEPKDHVKKRLGRSPDLADALALTFAIPDEPARGVTLPTGGSRGKMKSDWDPLADRSAAA